MKNYKIITMALIICAAFFLVKLFFLNYDLSKNPENHNKKIDFNFYTITKRHLEFKENWNNIWKIQGEKSDPDLNVNSTNNEYELDFDEYKIRVKGLFIYEGKSFTILEINNANKMDNRKMAEQECIGRFCIDKILADGVVFIDETGISNKIKIFKGKK